VEPQRAEGEQLLLPVLSVGGPSVDEDDQGPTGWAGGLRVVGLAIGTWRIVVYKEKDLCSREGMESRLGLWTFLGSTLTQ
jgi:hypothetical protein